MRTIITYKGEVIASLVPGQKAILHCEDKDVKGDLVVTLTDEVELKALPAPVITLDGDTLTILDESGLAERFVVRANGEVVKTMEVTRSLTAPTISLDGVFLTITDESGIAEEFDILVDGEVVETVSAKRLIEFTTVNDSVGIGSTYQAELGMSWYDWVDSEYNTSSIYVDEDGFVCVPSGMDFGWTLNNGSTGVVPESTITPNFKYSFSGSYSGGSN